jgi:hypothetical protein
MRPATVAVLVSTVGYLTSLGAFQPPGAAKFAVTPEIEEVLRHIRPDSLRGDLSFISSDLLEGRNTPSRGLDIAAEYIAAQFRRVGLEPAGDDGFFQTAHLATLEPNMYGFTMKFSLGDQTVTVPANDAAVSGGAALDLKNAEVFKIEGPTEFTAEQVKGKVVFVDFSRGGQGGLRITLQKLREGGPALTISLDRGGRSIRVLRGQRLLDPSQTIPAETRIAVTGQGITDFFSSLKPGLSGATVSVQASAPREKPVTARNVIGILRGSDPALRETYLLVTAHYDHLGMLPEGPGDRIFNGANDDGSGTVSVIELARALSSMKLRPRRSIVFMTFCGEEEGLVGSAYYAHHPVIPLEKTIGQINLEQLGRTDSSEGAQISNAALTGFGYTSLTEAVVEAGEQTGVRIYQHPKNNDLYFPASDNYPLAQAGVPAHTIGVSFEFPDYHAVGDEWQKIDYDNLAKVDRMVAVAVLMVAGSLEAPHWDESNPKTAPFVRAWKERRLPGGARQ